VTPFRWLPALALLALVVAALLTLRAWRRRRRVPSRPAAPTPRYPVVLAHGLFGFDEIAVVGQRHAYFRGVRERLETSLWQVNVARVARFGSIAERARDLATFIASIDAPRVNVVAHSMGGLDARWAISQLGMGKRIASLTTIGTPHRGTPLADLGDELLKRSGLGAALRAIGLPLAALQDLTTARLEALAAALPEDPAVAYGCVVGVARRQLATNPLLWPTRLYLSSCAGDNDGIVPASSQRWGDVVAEVEADHWAQIGWSTQFDAVEFYAGLLRELRGRGF
jgi:triacylglycerol lipase